MMLMIMIITVAAAVLSRTSSKNGWW